MIRSRSVWRCMSSLFPSLPLSLRVWVCVCGWVCSLFVYAHSPLGTVAKGTVVLTGRTAHTLTHSLSHAHSQTRLASRTYAGVQHTYVHIDMTGRCIAAAGLLTPSPGRCGRCATCRANRMMHFSKGKLSHAHLSSLCLSPPCCGECLYSVCRFASCVQLCSTLNTVAAVESIRVDSNNEIRRLSSNEFDTDLIKHTQHTSISSTTNNEREKRFGNDISNRAKGRCTVGAERRQANGSTRTHRDNDMTYSRVASY